MKRYESVESAFAHYRSLLSLENPVGVRGEVGTNCPKCGSGRPVLKRSGEGYLCFDCRADWTGETWLEFPGSSRAWSEDASERHYRRVSALARLRPIFERKPRAMSEAEWAGHRFVLWWVLDERVGTYERVAQAMRGEPVTCRTDDRDQPICSQLDAPMEGFESMTARRVELAFKRTMERMERRLRRARLLRGTRKRLVGAGGVYRDSRGVAWKSNRAPSGSTDRARSRDSSESPPDGSMTCAASTG